jgi:hypothetical protein
MAWELWLQAVAFAPPALPIEPAQRIVAGLAGAFLIVVAALLTWAAPVRTLRLDPAEDEVRLAPDALGASMRPLALLANPAPLLAGLWWILEQVSERVRVVVGLFEQRYYLLGVLAALITIMLLMAQ